MNTEPLRDLAFRIRYGFRGCPKDIGGVPFRIDEALRRFRVDGELAIQEVLRQYLPDGGVFLDVGANFGLHTLLGAHLVGERGNVVAVEPVPANLRLLNRNIRLNGLNNRCQIIPKALTADGMERVSMSVKPGLSLTAGIVAESREGTIEVGTTTLDACLANCGRHPDLVKIDVEGAEHEVLTGGALLLQERPTLLIEIHPADLPAFKSSADELSSYLRSLGYCEQRLGETDEHGNGPYHALFCDAHE